MAIDFQGILQRGKYPIAFHGFGDSIAYEKVLLIFKY